MGRLSPSTPLLYQGAGKLAEKPQYRVNFQQLGESPVELGETLVIPSSWLKAQ